MTRSVSFVSVTPGTFRPTLYGLRQLHPTLFHPTQDWFDGEAFMSIPLPDHARTEVPTAMTSLSPALVGVLPHAVELAAIYVKFPTHPIWRRYLWTADTDHDGQRVYLGENGRGLEIHRHLALTDRWGAPVWE